MYQFTIDSCCTDNLLCDKDVIEKLPRCWSNGHEFVKGNLIYSPNAPCYKCLCDENYDNQTDISQSPSCKPVECGIELHQLSYLQLGCIPVYFNDGLCCPFEFKCREYACCKTQKFPSVIGFTVFNYSTLASRLYFSSSQNNCHRTQTCFNLILFIFLSLFLRLCHLSSN